MKGIALVSGASTGFGAATVDRLVAAGYKVIAVARRQDKLALLAARHGPCVYPVCCDIRDREGLTLSLEQLPADFRSISVLVNNAGLALGLEPAQQAALSDWYQMIETNITGLVTLTHLVLPGMVERNNGHIVNVGSVAGEFPYPGANVYGATKAFVHQFSLNLRADLLGTALRVSVIEPGLSGGTEFSQVRFHGDEARAAEVYQGTQALTVDDIAEAILWMLSRPAHVNINTMSLMPISQSFSALSIHRAKA